MVSNSNPFGLPKIEHVMAFQTRPESRHAAMRAMKKQERRSAAQARNSSLRELLGEEAALELEAAERARKEEVLRQRDRAALAILNKKGAIGQVISKGPRRFKSHLHRRTADRSAVGEFLMATGLESTRSSKTSMLFPLGRTDHLLV